MTNPHPLDHEGIWCQAISPVTPRPRPALFLDRDGVVVEEVHYLHKAEETQLIDGAADMIKTANDHDWLVIIVTNQAGIARGLYGWDEFNTVQKRMLDLLARQGARVDAVYACPHHEKGKGEFHHPDHPARKPNPGMLTRAMDTFAIDAAKSWIVGDRASDLLAGKNADLKGGAHVLTGHGSRDGERDAAKAVAEDGYEVKLVNSITDLKGLVIA